MACGGDVRTSAGGVIVGGMMQLSWLLGTFTDALVADVLLPEHTQEAPLTAHVEHVGDRRGWWPMLQSHRARRRQPGRDTC